MDNHGVLRTKIYATASDKVRMRVLPDRVHDVQHLCADPYHVDAAHLLVIISAIVFCTAPAFNIAMDLGTLMHIKMTQISWGMSYGSTRRAISRLINSRYPPGG